MRVARYICDDRDDPEHGLLEVFHGGTGDWYVSMRRHEQADVPRNVRFRTSGGDHPHAAILCLAILYDIGLGQLDEALRKARLLVDALGRDRDIENHWPDPAT